VWKLHTNYCAMKQLIILVLAIMTPELFAQDHHLEEYPKTQRHGLHLTIATMHTYIPQSTITGKETLVLPSIGFDIDYYFKSRIGLGLHNDLELLIFEVKEEEGMDIEREYPLVLTLDLLYKVNRNTVLFAGPGIEFEQAQDYNLFRMGIEYIACINKTLTFSPIFSYDYRMGAYNTFSFGIGIGFELH